MTSYIKNWDGKTIPIDLTNDDIIITPQDSKVESINSAKEDFLKIGCLEHIDKKI